MREKLFYLFVVISFLSFGSVEAKQKSLFRVENDTILHICSNLSEVSYFPIFYGSCVFPPCDTIGLVREYFPNEDDRFVYYGYSTVIIDEGVDSLVFRLPIDTIKLLQIPSSLKHLSFYWESPVIEKIQMSSQNPYLRWEDGTMYNRDKTRLYFTLPNAGDSVLQIPETVTQVWSIPYRHYSKIVFPKHCEMYPAFPPFCDTLIIQSKHCPDWDWFAKAAGSVSSYLYWPSDSAVARIFMETVWSRLEWDPEIDVNKGRDRFHCPKFDVRKRDTSWMRESYRMTCVLDNGDTLVGVDTIPSGRYIESAKIEGIADENVYFRNQDQDGKDVYRFYVATYDTLYRLPLEVFVKPEEKEPEQKWSDFGEVKDSVLTIREDVYSLPDLRGSFRKVIVPKRTHYLEGSIECDSAFIYSDSLETSGYYENVWDKIDAHYYYVENEELYLSLKRRLMEKNQFQKSMEIRRLAVVYCPHADVRKRNMTLQQNTNKPVWRDSEGNIKNLTYRPWGIMTGLQLEIEGLDSQDLYVLDCRRKRFLQKSNGYFGFINDGKTAELEYAVWSYDTLLPLQQKDTVRFVKRDGTPWGKGYNIKECVLYYVPKGMTRHTLLESKDSIMMWRSGDTIPRRYANRLAFGMLLTNGDCNPSGAMEYDVLYLDKRNQYLRNGYLEGNQQLWKIPRQYKKIWLHHIKEYRPDCLPLAYNPMHFYIKR